jgi:hypothetical protein
MSDRLDRFLTELAEAVDGKRHLPVVRPVDAEAVSTMFHREVDRGCAARAEAAEAAGHTVACKAGCDDCCRNMPAVFAAEAVTIARWLERPEHAAAKAGFAKRYPMWRASVADLIDRWAVAAAARDVQAAGETAKEAWKRQVMCAFNDAGRCTIYEVRPNVCRNAHALDTNVRCRPDTKEQVATFPFAPLDDYFETIRPVVFAMNQAIRRDGVGSRPLCLAVHEQLQAAAPGRNDPCTCGSGKKYKKCCGAG